MESKKLNPFFSIWKSPRATTRFLLDNRPLYYFFGLAALFSIIYFIEITLFVSIMEPKILGEMFTTSFVKISFWLSISIICFTIAMLSASAVIYTSIAHELGGKEPIGKTFGAIVSSLIITLPWGLCASLFMLLPSLKGASAIALFFQLLCFNIISILPIYSLVVLITSISEAQKISIGRATLAFVIGTLIIISLLFAIYYGRYG